MEMKLSNTPNPLPNLPMKHAIHDRPTAPETSVELIAKQLTSFSVQDLALVVLGGVAAYVVEDVVAAKRFTKAFSMFEPMLMSESGPVSRGAYSLINRLGSVATPRRVVMLVDPDELILRAMKRTFESAQYRVIACETPSQALSAINHVRVDVFISSLEHAEMKGDILLETLVANQPAHAILFAASPRPLGLKAGIHYMDKVRAPDLVDLVKLLTK
jgi:CheY-like chemotaxis protein